MVGGGDVGGVGGVGGLGEEEVDGGEEEEDEHSGGGWEGEFGVGFWGLCVAVDAHVCTCRHVGLCGCWCDGDILEKSAKGRVVER